MKTLLVPLVLVLVLNYGSALKCHHCVPQSGTRCMPSQETCGVGKDACIAARFNFPPFMGFRRCSSKTECAVLQNNTAMKTKCCQSDLCNNVIIM
ncbi:cytotoxin homolog 5-like [Rhinichthys klamathensis goyatoka]|uniref:cytotoxin homolog 5-like n=1 Tax=Rhinichthys klamathensis goyatoka TaxID=3034132 RepID=UPI0024B5CE74|nr:cytotoxin homolog 5-like [Rhinichthys klamathensis goyatoka]